MSSIVPALVAATLLTACGAEQNGAQGDGLTPVTIISTPVADSVFIAMAQDKGFFKDEGLAVERAFGTGGAASLPAVVAGEYDMATGNVVSTMIARDQGLPVKIITPGGSGGTSADTDSGAILVSGSSKIKKPADLEGKTIAVNTLKNIGPLTINAALRAEGVDHKTVKYVEVPFPEMNAVIEKGEVDAGWVVEPFLTQGKKSGHRAVLANYSGTAANMPVSATFTTEKFIAENPEAVEGFVRAVKKALEYCQNHPQESRKLIAETSELDPQLAAEITLPTWRSDFNADAYSKMADLAFEYGYVEKRLDISELLVR